MQKNTLIILEVESTVLYTCCRDGEAKVNCLPKKTTQSRKKRGSRKTEGYCISRTTVTKEKSGKVSTRYIRTHTGHTPGISEARYLPLSQAAKQEVREKYALPQNVQLDSIIDGKHEHAYTMFECIMYICMHTSSVVLTYYHYWPPTSMFQYSTAA